MNEKKLDLILQLIDEDIESTPMGMSSSKIEHWGGTLTGSAGQVLGSIYMRYMDAITESRKINHNNAHNYMTQLTADITIMAQIPLWVSKTENTGDTRISDTTIKIMCALSSVICAIARHGADGSRFECSNSMINKIVATFDREALAKLTETDYEAIYAEAWKYYQAFVSKRENIELKPVEELLLTMASMVLDKSEEKMKDTFFDLVQECGGDKMQAILEIKKLMDHKTSNGESDGKSNPVNDILNQISAMKS